MRKAKLKKVLPLTLLLLALLVVARYESCKAKFHGYEFTIRIEIVPDEEADPDAQHQERSRPRVSGRDASSDGGTSSAAGKADTVRSGTE